MSNIVLLGGNGYVGRNVLKKWLEKDKESDFFLVSRSGAMPFENKRVFSIRSDLTNYQDLLSKLPEEVNYIVDFVGKPESDPEKFIQANNLPAETMLKIAQEKKVNAMGFIGGSLGPKSFIQGKQAIIDQLIASGIPTEVVSPTIVYGNGRKDSMMLFIPLLMFFGLFSKKLKPVHINHVVEELISKLIKH